MGHRRRWSVEWQASWSAGDVPSIYAVKGTYRIARARSTQRQAGLRCRATPRCEHVATVLFTLNHEIVLSNQYVYILTFSFISKELISNCAHCNVHVEPHSGDWRPVTTQLSRATCPGQRTMEATRGNGYATAWGSLVMMMMTL